MNVDESIKPDPNVDSMINKALDKHRDMLSLVVGNTKTALNKNQVMESTMDLLLLKALVEVSGEKLAFSNGWRYGAPVTPGPVLLNDFWKSYLRTPKFQCVKYLE